MEAQVLELLYATTTPDTNVIRQAEQGLLSLYPQPDFPLALLNLATNSSTQLAARKSALTSLRNYVAATWSPQLEESFTGDVYLAEDAKAQLRLQVLAICTGVDVSSDVKVQSLAGNVVSKIASVDFPDNWPQLFPELINVLHNAVNDAPALGALRVLLELVDSGLSEEQFFAVARDLVGALRHAATSNKYGEVVQAMSVNVLRSCFETLEQVLLTPNASAVRAFLDESMKEWISYFVHNLQQPLPEASAHENLSGEATNIWKGLIALKIQVVKTLEKIKRVHAPALTPYVMQLFTTIWEELSRLTPAFTQLFIEGDCEGKLVDSDGLPYTLDALALEEIDFLASALKAKQVRNDFNSQMNQLPNAEHTVGWMQELIRILVQYARIPREEENLWNFDASIYLAEASSYSANYTPRTACVELISRSLMDWLNQTFVKALLHFNETSATNASWKERESLLYLLHQAFKDFNDTSTVLETQAVEVCVKQVESCLQDGNLFLRAVAQLMLSDMFRVSPKQLHSSAAFYLSSAIRAATEDASELVNVCCINTIPVYLETLPQETTVALRETIVNAIQEFISKHDLREDLEDSAEVKSALIAALRAAILLDTSNMSDGSAIDLFFTLASDGASNFMLSEMLVDTFQSIVASVSEHGNDAYIRLCAKTIPALSGAFDIANMTQESSLTNLAAELVSALAEFGFDPLPDGFIAAVMPKLQRVLIEANDSSLLRPATSAVTHLLNKGTAQLVAWHDPNGKPAVQVTLEVVDRLLNSPDVDEAAADQVGYLASSMVTKLGADGLGDYLTQLLRAVAVRLATAEMAAFTQSLLMVFASLSVTHVDSVIDFLSQIDINGANGLDTVLTKWLENSVNFAGFDEIRTNSVALSKIYSMQNPRVKSIMVKGDLIVEDTGRIKTRSRAKLNPDRYTSIPADLKILKLLTDELHNAAASHFNGIGAMKAAQNGLADDGEDDDDNDDDGEWEDDDDDQLDLNSEQVKAELMGWAGEGPSPTGSRARDDEAADYLLRWFHEEGTKPGFDSMFAQLNEEERTRLQALVR